MRILNILKEQLIGKTLISCSDIELNDDCSVNVDFYKKNGLDVPVLGEKIINIGEGDSVDSYPTIRLYFSENNFFDVMIDNDLELE